ncbi:MAG: excinuclease ABC subunit C [Chlorobi bacterium OLB5]|nr:MAG: excinuclease ABC subunit C [Chlorobi bacterium OLB5]
MSDRINQKYFYIYIMTNKKNGTLYTGMTDDLLRRVFEHKNNLYKTSFTSIFNLHKLVYFEQTDDVSAAIYREKQIKKWNRDWKLKLIEDMNPNWNDLYYFYGGKEYEKNLDINELRKLYGNS